MAVTASRRNLVTALAFLAPNIVGVLTFVVFPVLFSILLAFTNWDLRRHNMYKDEPLQFVGFDNFLRLLSESDFLRFLGNTLFLMMGIPFSVAGALFAAILLSKDTRGGGGRVFLYLIATGLLISSALLLTVIGMGGTAFVILLTGLVCGILMLGLAGGVTAYRTLFYMPHFTAGVATFLLWKKLYNPATGPINQALQPVLDGTAAVVAATPSSLVVGLHWALLLVIPLLLWWGIGRLRMMWSDGDLGTAAAVISGAILAIAGVTGLVWSYTQHAAWLLAPALILAAAVPVALAVRKGREFRSPTEMEGFGTGLVLGLGTLVVQFTFLGLAAVVWNLPAMASDGLQPPEWLTDYHWAKPSLMIMGFWAAVGSNNMLLYLAALTNVPQELYEASDIDGATRLQRFWHVTWPQLAPTTFFIAVMSTIGGLQGGFEAARTMTQGGPDGSTTTLAYFIYIEGFETGRLSFASAVSWTLFLLVFSITMFNWRFGNKYVND